MNSLELPWTFKPSYAAGVLCYKTENVRLWQNVWAYNKELKKLLQQLWLYQQQQHETSNNATCNDAQIVQYGDFGFW